MSSHVAIDPEPSRAPEQLPQRPKCGFAVQEFADIAHRRHVLSQASTQPPARRNAADRATAQNLKHIGRIGALAVALGVGGALASAPVIAHADTNESTSPHSVQRAAEDSPAVDRSVRRAARTGDAQPQRPARHLERPHRGPVRLSDRARADESSSGRGQIDLSRPLKRLFAGTPPTAPGDTNTPVRGSILLAASTSAATRRTVSGVAHETTATTTSAGGQDVVVEAETMVLSSSKNGSVYSDATASGGAAVVLNKNSSISKTVSLPSSTSVVIRAKGDQYRGAPLMRVSVNGTELSTVAVSATSWTNYTIPYNGAAGTYTLTIAFTNDLAAKKSGDRNLRLDTVRVVAAAVTPAPPTTGAPYFSGADWLWKPIPANAAVDANSATWVDYLAQPGKPRIANLYQYAVTLITASKVTSTTPRYDVSFSEPWGSDPFGSSTVPIPLGTKVPPGSDGQLAILDPTTGMAYGIWQARYHSDTNTWSGSWGGKADLNGNGVDQSGSATATGIARYAGVVTGAEFAAAVAANTGIDHALVFSTDLAGSQFVAPAIKSDGQNIAGVAVPIPEGYRIQLDPSIDVDALPGITAGEKVIAKTLQTYGAYVVDQGAARMAFAFELLDDATPTSPGAAYVDAGFAWDYYDMGNIPWSGLRVLAPTTVTV